MALNKNELNGWNLDQFQSVVKMVKDKPESGDIRFQTFTKWDEDFGVDNHTDEIGTIDKNLPRKFTLRGDHPQELLGMNTGPTAVETLLAALGSCICGTYAAQATARGIDIENLETEINGNINLQGFLQLAPIRAGFSDIKVKVKVKSDGVDESKLKEIGQLLHKASPVTDSLASPVKIEISTEKQ